MQHKYLPTIGLEIHVQLKTKSKMFCSCPNNSWKIGVEEFEPNSAICPVCTGQPGTLPVANESAIKMVIKTGLALNCQISAKSKFDRKHYFYPDLPKGYQISQYDEPLCYNGYLKLGDKDGETGNQKLETRNWKLETGNKFIRIRRIHLEEDTAKLTHDQGDYSLIDFNRAGVPLMELVTEPDIHSAGAAKQFCQKFQQILRILKVGDADMERGQLRCEVNISIARIKTELTELKPNDIPNSNQLGTKVEVKNLNSFKAVERSIEYEIIRQTKILEKGEKIVHETRGWSDKEQVTVAQRTKEESHDYRYFPEPDLPLIKTQNSINKTQGVEENYRSLNNQFSAIDVDEIKRSLPEMPEQKIKRFRDEYGFIKSDAEIIISNPALADFTENAMTELRTWLVHLDEIEIEEDRAWDEYKQKLSKLMANWLINKLGGLLNAAGTSISQIKITPENFAELITLIYKNKINSNLALELLQTMLDTGGDPSNILEDRGWRLIEDVGDLEPAVNKAIKDNPQQVKQFQSGKIALIKFFIGQIMKETKGRANPKMAEEMLRQKLA